MLNFIEDVLPDGLRRFLLLLLIVANGIGFVFPTVWHFLVIESTAAFDWHRVMTFYVIVTALDFFYIIFYGLFRRD